MGAKDLQLSRYCQHQQSQYQYVGTLRHSSIPVSLEFCSYISDQAEGKLEGGAGVVGGSL